MSRRLLPTVRDSRGRESHTLMFVAWAAGVLILKFALAGLTVPYVGAFPHIGASEFGIAFAGVMAVWLGREWTEKAKPPGAGP